MTDDSSVEGVAPDEAHPCCTEDGSIEHEWEFRDDSFDHDLGVEVVHYWCCARCDATKPLEPGDFDDDDDYEEPQW